MSGVVWNMVYGSTCQGAYYTTDLDSQVTWGSYNTSIAQIGNSGSGFNQIYINGMAPGSTTIYGQVTGYPPCQFCNVQGYDTVNVVPSVSLNVVNPFAFVGSDPTVPQVLMQAIGNPGNGTYSWTATPAGKVSFDNPAAAIVHASGINYSTSVGDTTITVNYTVNGQPASPATVAVTSRLFKFLQQSGSVQVIPISGPPTYGYISYVYHNVFTFPGGQILQPGFGGISVYESVTLTSTNFPLTEVTGSGATTQDSQVVDQLSVIADSALPSNFSATSDQYLGVGGFVIRHHTLTQTASGPSITNLGPYN